MNFQYSKTGNKRWKYKLDVGYEHNLGFIIQEHIGNAWIDLFPSRLLLAVQNYHWDGVTYFFDLKCMMRASLVHDVLLQLIREGLLPKSYRVKADREFRRICIEEDCPVWLAKTAYYAIRSFVYLQQQFSN